MRIVDIHTHLYREPNMEVEADLANQNVERITRDYIRRTKAGPADHAVAIVMDDDFLLHEGALSTLLSIRDDTEIFSVAYLIDPCREDAEELVERAAESGAVGVKFHPYMQSLTSDTWSRIKRVGEVIEERDLSTIVDCSYGSELLYETNGVELGHELAREVTSPVLLAHGGGPRVLDAFSSADAMSNVYLDTSFSLQFWDGSSLIQDYGFAAGRLGGEKILWGSDSPFINQKQSFERARNFAERYIEDENRYFGKTADKLIR